MCFIRKGQPNRLDGSVDFLLLSMLFGQVGSLIVKPCKLPVLGRIYSIDMKKG